MTSSRGCSACLAVVLLAVSSGCERGHKGDDAEAEARELRHARVAKLLEYEEAQRATTDFARARPATELMGPDPYRALPLPGGDVLVALRGADRVVRLGAEGQEKGTVAGVRRPTALLAVDDETVWVGGEVEGALMPLEVGEQTLVARAPVLVPGLRSARSLAAGPGSVVYIADPLADALVTVRLLAAGAEVIGRTPVGIEPIEVDAAGGFVVVNSLLSHRLDVFRVGADGVPVDAGHASSVHDGPFWTVALLEDAGRVWVIAGGVEDHPLDRTGGSFGYIDSFLWAYAVDIAEDGVLRLTEAASLNLSAHGVVTPKSVAPRVATRLEGDSGTLELLVTGYGAARALRTRWDRGAFRGSATVDVPPGTSHAFWTGRAWVLSNPLLDAVVTLEPANKGGRTRVVPVVDARRPTPPVDARLGEALAFTTLMAPGNRSEGELSRFTCETCHFEGAVDGRTHATGRGEVVATTKPLLGLFNNRPHFTRALDPTMAKMVHAEFRVAGANSGFDPWFTARLDDHPWLAALGVGSDVEPFALRRALMAFLMRFHHAPNPRAAGRTAFDDGERKGADAFLRRCASCHAPRLVADDPTTSVARADWEALIFSASGPIVWARDGYEKTGVTPYVHARGARPTSLRRLHKKRPYFTTGLAPSLERVLQLARVGPDGRFWHQAPASAADVAPLDEAEQRDLLAFLHLL